MGENGITIQSFPNADEVTTKVQGLESEGKTVVLFAIDSHLGGYVAIADEIKPEAKATVKMLKKKWGYLHGW